MKIKKNLFLFQVIFNQDFFFFFLLKYEFEVFFTTLSTGHWVKYKFKLCIFFEVYCFKSAV